MFFAQKINVYLLKTGLVKIVDLLVIFFVARYMGPEPLGLISFGTAYVTLFLIISNLGFDTAHVKRVSEGKDLGLCVGTYFSFKVVVCTIIVASVLISLYFRKAVLGYSFNHPDQEKVIILVLIPIVLVQLSMVISGTFEGQTKAAKGAIPNIVAPLIRAPFSISVAILGMGVYWLIYSRILRSLVLLLVFLYLFKNYPVKRPTLAYFKSYFSFAWKLFFYTMFAIISLQISRLLLGTYHGVNELGIYTTVHILAATFLILPASVKTLLFPTISNLMKEEGNIAKIKNYVYKGERYISIILLPLIITLGFFSKEVITILLGDEFTEGSFTLSLLCFWVYVDGTKSPFGMQLVGMDRLGLSVIIGSITIFIHIILNVLLIPNEINGVKLAGMGMEGAAVASILSILVLAFLYRFAVYKLYGTKFNKSLFFHFLAGIVLLLFYFNVNLLYSPLSTNLIQSLIMLMFYSIVGFTIYFIFLVVFKEVKKEDYEFFIDSINPKNTKRYVFSEVKNGKDY